MNVLHAWLKFYLERPVFDIDQLQSLGTLLQETLPSWCTGLAAAQHEDSVRVAVAADNDLSSAVHEAAPLKKYGLARAVLTGSYPGVSFFLHTSRKAFPPESNGFSVEIIDVTVVEGQPPSTWAWDFFRRVPACLAVRYANARLDAEFEAKNLDTSNGARALGVNLQESLPGLYWLNFFGAPYATLLGKERLLSAPGHEVDEVDDGVFIALASDPGAWGTPAYQQREKQVLEHLGRKYFFLRQEPHTETIGADFLAR